MVQTSEADSVINNNKTSNHSFTDTSIYLYEDIMNVDDVSGDYSYSSSSDTSGIGSTIDINKTVATRYQQSFLHHYKKTELRHTISEHRKNCWKHLDYIESLIDDTSQKFNNKKYLILQNEIKIQQRISETKDEIQKLKNSVYNQTVEQIEIFDSLKIVYIVIVWAIVLFFSILCCWDSSVCYNWLHTIQRDFNLQK